MKKVFKFLFLILILSGCGNDKNVEMVKEKINEERVAATTDYEEIFFMSFAIQTYLDLDEWYVKNNTFSGFTKDKNNLEKMDVFIRDNISKKLVENPEHRIYTKDDKFVIKFKNIKGDGFYCTDNNLIKGVDVQNKFVEDMDKFDKSVDCENINI